MKKLLRQKIGKLQSRDVVIATNFVTATSWHSPPFLFVLAFYGGWEDRKTYTTVPIPQLAMNLYIL